MNHGIVKEIYKKGSRLRSRCGQIRVSEIYSRPYPIFLYGRTVLTGSQSLPPDITLLHISRQLLLILKDTLPSFIDLLMSNEVILLNVSDVAHAFESVNSSRLRNYLSLLLHEDSRKVLLAYDDFTIEKDQFHSSIFFPMQRFVCLSSDVCPDPSVTVPLTALAISFDEFLNKRKTPENFQLITLLLDALHQQGQPLDHHMRDDEIEFPQYVAKTEWTESIKAGNLYVGRIRMYEYSPFEGEVDVDGLPLTIRVCGKVNVNRAFHGDEVIVRLLPKSQWLTTNSGSYLSKLSGISSINSADDSNPTEDSSTDDFDETEIYGHEDLPYGVVVGIVERSEREFVATVPANPKENPDNSTDGSVELSTVKTREEFVLLIPLQRNLPRLRLLTRQWSQLQGQQVAVRFDSWPRNSAFPNVHFLHSLGAPGDWQVEVKSILAKYSIFPRPFSLSALACLPRGCDHADCSHPSVLPELESYMSQRRDLRNGRFIFSVDPPGCQDIDDSMGVEWVGDGKIEIVVNIADVCAFLAQGSALDVEAESRGTTVYLPHTRHEMLPSLLSSNLASLHANVDRLAVSVAWIVDVLHCDGTPVKSFENFLLLDESNDVIFKLPTGGSYSWAGRAVIRSCAAMTYLQAHRLIQGISPNDDYSSNVPPCQAGRPVPPSLWSRLQSDLKLLTVFSRMLSRERTAAGSMQIAHNEGAELKFSFHGPGNPCNVEGKEDLEIHETIAELMILANSAVAKCIEEAFPREALVRHHPRVSTTRISQLLEDLKRGGIGQSHRERISADLRNIRSKLSRGGAVNDHVISAMVSSAIIRTLSRANYICSGELSGTLSFGEEANTPDSETISGIEKLKGHFGLGLLHYTHFTSPIRRYADVIVHRQFLQALDGWTPAITLETHERSRKEIQFAKIPDSALPSVTDLCNSFPVPEIASGNNFDRNDVLDDLLSGGTGGCTSTTHEQTMNDLLDNLLLGSNGEENAVEKRSCEPAALLDELLLSDVTQVPHPAGKCAFQHRSMENAHSGGFCYTGSEVKRLAHHLNEKNANAKAAQYYCQQLFLGLYLLSHSEVREAVIYTVKSNSLFVYVPAFDFRGPVYLTDNAGRVMITPSLLDDGSEDLEPRIADGFTCQVENRGDDGGLDCISLVPPVDKPGKIVKLRLLQKVLVRMKALRLGVSRKLVIRLDLVASSLRHEMTKSREMETAEIVAENGRTATSSFLEPKKRLCSSQLHDFTTKFRKVKKICVQLRSISLYLQPSQRIDDRLSTAFPELEPKLMDASIQKRENAFLATEKKENKKTKKNAKSHNCRQSSSGGGRIRYISQIHDGGVAASTNYVQGKDSVFTAGYAAARMKMDRWGEVWAEEEDLPDGSR